MSDIDPGDMLAQRALQDEARTKAFADVPVEEPSAPVDPANRNLAMQLAIQHSPGADMATLTAAADEFYSYLTQHE